MKVTQLRLLAAENADPQGLGLRAALKKNSISGGVR
jgi:hypothetical protein